MSSIKHFENKTVLITGASRGLGKKLAYAFAESGAHTLLLALDKVELKKIQTHLSQKFPTQTCSIVCVDLSDENQLTEFAKHSAEQFDIDIVIHNAAIQGPIGPIWETDWQEWKAATQINLLSPIFLTKCLLEKMRAKNAGRIIFLAGGGATSGRPNFSCYAFNKTGLVRFTECLGEEIKNSAITVNCISPGVMDTDMVKKIMQEHPHRIHEKEFLKMQNALNEKDNLQAASDLCLFLASDDANKINGKILSAEWDNWKNFPQILAQLRHSDMFTLRRVTPQNFKMDTV